jgi:hypothetical protein
LNSFMLYRRCYSQRFQAWSGKNNNQDVSAVLGASWAMETEEVRNRFAALYVIEERNHRKAFPHYKYAPNKSGTNKNKRKSEEPQDSDDDWERANKVPRRTRQGRTPSYGNRYTSHRPIEQEHAYTQSNDWSYPNTRVQWQPQHIPEIMPQYAPPQPAMPYYDTGIAQAMNQERLMQELYHNSLVGVPMGTYSELNLLRSNATTPAPAVDPSLPSSYGITRPILHSQNSSYSVPYPDLPPPNHAVQPLQASRVDPVKQMPVFQPTKPAARQSEILQPVQPIEPRDGQESWGNGVDSHDIPGLEHNGEFERYMSPHHDDPVHEPEEHKPNNNERDAGGNDDYDLFGEGDDFGDDDHGSNWSPMSRK